MATYSTNLALTLMATGEQSNTWGDTTNTNLGTLLEQSISGYVTQAITDGSGANTTITIPNGTTGVARNMYIEMTGALSFSTTSLIVPANKKMYFIFNNTSGGFAVTVKVSGQTGVLVPNGKKVILTSNGTDIVEAANQVVGAFGVGGTATMAAINASGLVAMAGAATVGTTLGVTGTSSLGVVNASGIISAPVGSVGSPSFSFTGDTTLGMYRVGAQNGGLVASSGVRLQWDGTSVYVNNLVIDIANANANISRIGAGTLAIGTGAIGSTAGSLSLTSLTASGTSTMAAINASGSVTLSGTSFFRSPTTSNVPGTFNFYLAASGIREGTAGDVNIDTYSGGWGARLTVSQAGAVTIPGTATIQTLTVGLGGGAVATNTAVGVSALAATNTNTNHVAVGYQALQSNTSGGQNTAVGSEALKTNTTSSSSTAVGFYALRVNTAANSTAVGAYALYQNTSGTANTGLGLLALGSNTTGAQNVAVGYQAGEANTTGQDNQFIGLSAGRGNTTASYNVAIGTLALGSTSNNSNENVAIGYYSLSANTGGKNTAIGSEALTTNSTGANNTAVGFQAGYSNTTGESNINAGHKAGFNITTGVYNTCIGREAGVGYGAIITGNYNTCIGSGAGVNATSSTYEISIGLDCQGVGSGYFTFGRANGADRVYNQFTANASWTRVSDVRIKKDIQDSNLGLEFINKLRTVTYKKRAPSEMDKDFPFYKANETEIDHKEKMYGFIAQEVKQALDDVGATDFAGWHEMTNGVQGVSYEMFVMPLVKAIQELNADFQSYKNSHP